MDPPVDSDTDWVDTDMDFHTGDTDDTDDQVSDVLECTVVPSEHSPHPTCDPTPVLLDIIPGYPPMPTRGCMVGDVCFGPADRMRPTDFRYVLDQGRDVRSPMACCSQDGVAYRYVTFYDDWSWLILYYDEEEVLQGVQQIISVGPAPIYCLNPDGASVTRTGIIWDGKILDHCL